MGALLGSGARALGATAKPAWQLSARALPTNLRPGSGSKRDAEVFLYAGNVGGKAATTPITLTDTLPEGVKPFDFSFRNSDPLAEEEERDCEISGQTISCTDPGPLAQGRHLEVRVFVEVKSTLAEGALPNEVAISGGGATPDVAQGTLQIAAAPPAFDFLPGFKALPIEADGGPATLAGSHPYALNLNFSFPTERHPDGVPLAAGHVRDVITNLPRGEIINPKATKLCTEAELVTEVTPGCPATTAVGTLTVTTVPVLPEASTFPLYNMVPPPGQAAELGADAFGVGFFIHIRGGVRSDGDYGIIGTSPDILARTANPVLDVSAELWGDPSDPAHNSVRGICSFNLSKALCPVPKTETALLTLPGDCPHTPLTTEVQADSWEEPSPPAPLRHVSYGAPEVKGCDGLAFKPTIEAKPTTNLTDSPSGLNVELEQPQDFSFEGRSPATLKDISLTLPEGLTVNPSQANGLQACTLEQIGLMTAIGKSPVHFTKAPDQCPSAAKLGTVSVSTPLLDHPLPGSIYIAKPFANPFGSLLAVYLSVNDPQSGVVAKFGGEVHADPVSGQLSTSFKETPELPLEQTSVHLFTGARAALRTPPACATYPITAHMVPWSAPEGTPVDQADPFAITHAPGGAPCPSSASAAPNKPNFVAGTLEPKAGAYSPFVLKVSREDGSQPLGGFEATLPAGLTAKLAGVPACSEAQIAAAKARSEPNEGALELASPSCPAATEIGTVEVAAGAGPTPLNVTGHLYMAGPYKGAPLSAVIITPAVAGPFDLGVVAVRAAIYLDRETALVRTVSDPLPTILDGIPLDLRSATVRLARPKFTLNPTSCEPKSTLATATSVFGQPAALTSRFQVGACKSLPYKPKLHTRLFGPIHRGGHPRFRAVFEAKSGEANSGRIVFVLPPSEFIDQAHFRTICTRVQFAANQCPPGSIYGHVRAITPLLGYPLEGPVYLRSSSHELPDAVVALRGPASQPIEIDLAGRVDSVGGGLRTTFESVPDAPVSKVVVTLQGAKKGLFQNSTNICKGIHRASVRLTAQNAKVAQLNPLMKADCKAPKKKGKGGGPQPLSATRLFEK